ncbi:hypothetical protein [Thermosulfurimonas sp. F29]|uniref:hypothetical protein n=1 Tax=Thermosulfurimonas sp. F29 TaxID=2867247 RepID=UPI001C830046|nr:hypothetical protein [Thermosulfurimonas sp. F29]MBX6424194.1 hypothetical protein [Thermosulfurimonas sp. F29]
MRRRREKGFVVTVLLLLVGAMLLTVFAVSQRWYPLKAHLAAEAFRRETPIPMPAESRPIVVEEAERTLIRVCEMLRALVIKCQECYATGRTFCPYPTDAFCSSARGFSLSSPLYWAFLPNASGSLSEVFTQGGALAPSALTNVSQLPLVGRYWIRTQVAQADWTGLRYVRPGNTGADPCAVDGVVTR